MAKNINVKYILGLDVNEFRTGMQRVSGTLNNMQNQFNNLGRAIGGAFALYQIKDFTEEAIEMGSALQKVQAGFARFGDASDLAELRKSTRGLMTDLELMQQTVKGANLGIPFERMGQYLEFAKRRADETGESIDFLVESIVTGIGRRSPMKLDNLGVTAERLKEALGGVSFEMASVKDFADAMTKIATEELTKMGKPIETAADDMTRLRVEFANFKAELGQGLNDVIAKSWKNYSNFFKMLNAFAKGNFKDALAFGTMLIPKETNSQLDFVPTTGKPAETQTPVAQGVQDTSKYYKDLNAEIYRLIGLQEQQAEGERQVFRDELVAGWTPLVLEAVDMMEGELVPILEKTKTEFDNVALVASQFGHILTSSFEAAISTGTDFFETMGNALKAYVQQLMAAVAATAALSVVSMAFGGGTFLQAFGKIGTSTGLASFFGGDQEFIGRVKGFELLLQQNRAGRNSGLINGN